MVPAIGRLYAEAFWLTDDVREEGRAGSGGADVDVDVPAETVDVASGVAVVADGTGIDAAARGGQHGMMMMGPNFGKAVCRPLSVKYLQRQCQRQHAPMA